MGANNFLAQALIRSERMTEYLHIFSWWLQKGYNALQQILHKRVSML